ncbi:MAG: hypothetical protein JRN35_05185 [Nitrososphaerota archaeon]|jgi:hypothetical protein|nr:hypothetical protein [Nitrososphaerota archaeon]MDG6949740.1 hypothetical protein [Nitrososphaerota archaeon]
MAAKGSVDPVLLETLELVMREYAQGTSLHSRLRKLMENLVRGQVPDEDIVEIIEAVKLVPANGR